MAINPNTDFSAGAVLTASQQNRFPRGIMAYDSLTSSDTTVTAEEVQITGSSFTAVANRYYRVTYFEPNIVSVTATSWVRLRIRSSSISGTTRQESLVQVPTSGVTNVFGIAIWIGTLSAGTANFVGTGQSNVGTASFVGSSTGPRFLMVEDLGPA